MTFPKHLLALLFFISFILILGCTQQINSASQSLNTNEALQFGDIAIVDYILVVNTVDSLTNLSNESVYDTSLESIARSSGIYNPNRKYEPLRVKLDNANGMLPGFTRALVGMKKGENKTFTLSPENGYGVYDKKKVFTQPRFYTSSRYDQIPLFYFQTRNLSYAEGTNLSTKFGIAQVINSTNQSVLVKYYPEINKSFLFNGLPEKVVNITDDNITIELIVQKGVKYNILSPSGSSISVLITEINDTHVVMDANNPLAGKTLKFTVFVREVQKA